MNDDMLLKADQLMDRMRSVDSPMPDSWVQASHIGIQKPEHTIIFEALIRDGFLNKHGNERTASVSNWTDTYSEWVKRKNKIEKAKGDDELAKLKPLNRWYNNNPFWVWVIGFIVGALVTNIKDIASFFSHLTAHT